VLKTERKFIDEWLHDKVSAPALKHVLLSTHRTTLIVLETLYRHNLKRLSQVQFNLWPWFCTCMLLEHGAFIRKLFEFALLIEKYPTGICIRIFSLITKLKFSYFNCWFSWWHGCSYLVAFIRHNQYSLRPKNEYWMYAKQWSFWLDTGWRKNSLATNDHGKRDHTLINQTTDDHCLLSVFY
jgi:hypothetical protein